MCARAFGATIEMRDEPLSAPIPEEFKATTYHAKNLEESKVRLVELAAMPPEEAAARALESYNAECARRAEYERERKAKEQRYVRMLAKAHVYVAPTPDHEGLRSFMIDQLQRSIDFDCNFKHPPLAQVDGQAWLNEQIESAAKDVKYHAEAVQKELELSAQRTAWVKALRESLKGRA